ncbi:hypothetical protein VSR69_38515 [Paraburkholderia phytofirmans]
MANTPANCPCNKAFAEYRTIPCAAPDSVFGGVAMRHRVNLDVQNCWAGLPPIFQLLKAIINVPTRKEVSVSNGAIFDNLKKNLGTVPNLYATFALSESALATYLALQNAKSSVSGKARDVVNLLVSQVNECEECIAATPCSEK